MSRSDVLVDGDWLESRLGDPRVLVLEVDERPLVYRLGHIPGAHCLDWRSDLQDPLTRDIPDAAAMRRLWERLGVGQDTTVVLYGDRSNWYACFGFWLLRLYGLANLRLLDGGRQAWLADERPLTVEEPQQPASGQVPEPRIVDSIRAGWRDVEASLNGAIQLLDVRTPAEYRGDIVTEPGYPQEGAQRAGHIPTALSVPWDLAVDECGRIFDEGTLRERLAERGVDPRRPCITYCRIGERSAHTWFVLHELLGVSAANYDGSWTEWGSMIGMPVALGDSPSGE